MPSVIQIGKEGLSNPVIDSARAAITARELVKAHVLNNANLDTQETWPICSVPNWCRLLAITVYFSRRRKKNPITNLLKPRK